MRSFLRKYKNISSLYWHDAFLHLSGAYRTERSVSFCTGVKDRLEHLQETVIKNLEDNKDYPSLEIVILNYDCPNPKTERWIKSSLHEHIQSGRVNYYYYPDAPNYEMSHAKNLAHRLAKGDILCNLDADNFTGPGFARFISAQLNDGHSYLTGPRDGRGLGGRIALLRQHFKLTGGYDERFTDWGSEDSEFISRLNQLELNCRHIFRSQHLNSIQHSDELRMRYSKFDDKWESNEASMALSEANQSEKLLNPNGISFGTGHVQHNFRKWITVR